MKKALLIKTDGTEQIVESKNKKGFSLEELQGFVGGLIEIVGMPNGQQFYLNEEGKLIGLPINEKATEIWKQQYPIKEYPQNNDELIVGDVLLTLKKK